MRNLRIAWMGMTRKGTISPYWMQSDSTIPVRHKFITLNFTGWKRKKRMPRKRRKPNMDLEKEDGSSAEAEDHDEIHPSVLLEDS